ncbi:DJ-1/PfpI family protein [Nonomuraea ferruginea]
MSEAKRTIHVAAYDTMADWEVGHATAHLRTGRFHRDRSGFEIVMVGLTRDPVTTMGGLRVTPDLALDELSPSGSALLIPARRRHVGRGGRPHAVRPHRPRVPLRGVPVAAICGATAGLAREGLLDGRAHTSGAVQYLEAQEGYSGAARYVETDAVTDGDLITAGPTEPVAFAREIFLRLDVNRPEIADAWYRLFSRSDASAYEVLMSA